MERTNEAMDGVGKVHIHCVTVPITSCEPGPRTQERGPGPLNRMGPYPHSSSNISLTVELANVLHPSPVHRTPCTQRATSNRVFARQALSSEPHCCGRSSTALPWDSGISHSASFHLCHSRNRMEVGMPAVLPEQTNPLKDIQTSVIYIENRSIYLWFNIIYTP